MANCLARELSAFGGLDSLFHYALGDVVFSGTTHAIRCLSGREKGGGDELSASQRMFAAYSGQPTHFLSRSSLHSIHSVHAVAGFPPFFACRPLIYATRKFAVVTQRPLGKVTFKLNERYRPSIILLKSRRRIDPNYNCTVHFK